MSDTETSEAPSPDHRPFPTKRSRLLVALAIVGSCMALDQWTKKAAQDHFEERYTYIEASDLHPAAYVFSEGPRKGEKVVYRYWSDTIRFEWAENTGAFLGWGNDFEPRTRFLLLTLATGLFLVAMAIYALLHWNMELSKFVGVQLILAGGLGNLVDRVLYEGTVIDFMNMGIGGLRTGIFNVADVGITAGAILLLLLSFKRPSEARAPKTSVPERA